jgi:hypothetical protein
LRVKDIALQFPGRTHNNVRVKTHELQSRIPGPHSPKHKAAKLSRLEAKAPRTALEPYIDEWYTCLTHVQEAFPNKLRSQISNVLSRMRQSRKKNAETTPSDESSVQVKDE